MAKKNVMTRRSRTEVKPERSSKAAKSDEFGLYDVTPIGFSRQRKCWEVFFQCQRSPVLRSQMLTTLMAGTALQAECVPTSSLLDAVLISFAARVYCEAEVVDDYARLLERTEELWRAPDWTSRVFNSIHGNTANFIINHGAREFVCAEEQYVPLMARWYLEHDCPEYFETELTEAEMTAHWGLKGAAKTRSVKK
jgi:hypothetical protein